MPEVRTPHSLDKQRESLAALQQSALTWWEMRRPTRWSLAQHLRNPGVNTATPDELRLAKAVAAAVDCGAV